MPSQVTKRGAKTPQMNMTPLIDVTFQLILFFMLVNNIISQESIPMQVPRLSDPQTVEHEDVRKITINVAGKHAPGEKRDATPLMGDGQIGVIRVGSLEEWNIGAGEISLSDALDEITRTIKESKQQTTAQNKELHVDLRADASLHYHNVRPVLIAVTQAEVATLNLVAYLDENP